MDAVVIYQILRLTYQIQDNKSHDFQNGCSGDLSDDEREVHRTFSPMIPTTTKRHRNSHADYSSANRQTECKHSAGED